MAANKKAMDNLAADISDMSTKLSYMMEKMENMEKLLTTTQAENLKLGEVIKHQADEITFLKDRINDREQYARSWSIRCLNIPLTKDRESDTRYVMQQVYDVLLKPILEGAVENEEIPAVPKCDDLLEMAHILPAKKDSNKPVIVRFYSRFMRSLVFRYRKNFAPREEKTAGPSGGAVKAPKMKYSFFEDLSKETYAKLTEIKREPEVQSAWTVSGSIRFKTKNSEQIYKVQSLSESFADIVE